MRTDRALLAIGSALVASCYQLPPAPHHVVASEPVSPAGAAAAWQPPHPGPAVLYARDGTPVSVDAPPLAAVETGAPIRDLDEPQESRLYLLELYQRAVDERDELALEVDGLTGDLQQARAEGQERALENAELRHSLEQAQSELERLRARELELAGRLATAQIRRLEAEKVLLETTLEWDRLNRLVQPPPEVASQ